MEADLTPEQPVEVIEVSMETLDDLQRAWNGLTGSGESALTMNEAHGLILSYLPALLEMARQMLEENSEEGRLSVSAHTLLSSAH